MNLYKIYILFSLLFALICHVVFDYIYTISLLFI